MKLNKKQHISKVAQADLAQVRANLENQDKHLQPAGYLSFKGAQYFAILSRYLEKQSTTDAQIDSLQVNQLAEELAAYDIASSYLSKQGLVVDGKKNPLIMIRNNALKNSISLASAMGLTISGRIKNNVIDVQQGNTSDPLAELFGAKDND